MNNYHWALLTVFIATGGLVGWHKLRGIRNNNPGNIRRSNDDWDGLALVQSDPDFFRFSSAKYGIRAMAKLLLNYQNIYGKRSVEQIISRWAPSNENNTDAYINSVANALGVHPNENISGYVYLPGLINAIIKHENGMNPYAMEKIYEAIDLV